MKLYQLRQQLKRATPLQPKALVLKSLMFMCFLTMTLTACENIQTQSTIVIPDELIRPVTIDAPVKGKPAKEYIIYLMHTIDDLLTDRDAVAEIVHSQSGSGTNHTH